MTEGHRRTAGLRRAARAAPLAAEAAVLSTVVRAGLRSSGAAATVARAQRLVPKQHRSVAHRDAHQHAERVAYATWGITARQPFRCTCLPRSITLWVLLRRRGVPAELRVGVAGSSADFASHAWVEVDGRPLGEPAAVVAKFSPLPLEGFLASGAASFGTKR